MTNPSKPDQTPPDWLKPFKDAEALEARNLLADAIVEFEGEHSSSLVACARRIVELLHQERRVKAAIQADAAKSHDAHLVEQQTLRETYKQMLADLFMDISTEAAAALQVQGFASALGIARRDLGVMKRIHLDVRDELEAMKRRQA